MYYLVEYSHFFHFVNVCFFDKVEIIVMEINYYYHNIVYEYT